MAFVEKKLPADAPIAQKALGWVDSRFPLTKLWEDQWGKYYAPKNFNFFYLFGSLAALAGDSDCHRYFPGDELQAGCAAGICFG